MKITPEKWTKFDLINGLFLDKFGSSTFLTTFRTSGIIQQKFRAGWFFCWSYFNQCTVTSFWALAMWKQHVFFLFFCGARCFCIPVCICFSFWHLNIVKMSRICLWTKRNEQNQLIMYYQLYHYITICKYL